MTNGRQTRMFGLGRDSWFAMHMSRYQLVIALLMLGLIAFVVIIRAVHDSSQEDRELCPDYKKVCRV